MRLRVVDHGEDTSDVGSEFARNPRHHLRVLLLVELQNTKHGVLCTVQNTMVGADPGFLGCGEEAPTRGVAVNRMNLTLEWT